MNQDWLSQLAPDHAPAAVGWWPPAPGWWIVAVLAIVLAFVIVRVLRDPRRVLRQAALRQLKVIRTSDADGPAVARAVQNLIRRYALEVFGHERVARLAGDQWLSFVMEGGGSALAGPTGRSMLTAAFSNQGADDRAQWFAGAEGFIRRAGKKRGGRNRSTPNTSPTASAAGTLSTARRGQ
jgi:hypothetical protein